MNFRHAYQKLIRSFPGGWQAMAAALGLSSQDALENRVYERRGQEITVHMAMMMQKLSGSCHFAEEVARQSGGVFIKLPSATSSDKVELLEKINVMHANVGGFSHLLNESTRDGEIDSEEREKLAHKVSEMHVAIIEAMNVATLVYCRRPDTHS